MFSNRYNRSGQINVPIIPSHKLFPTIIFADTIVLFIFANGHETDKIIAFTFVCMLVPAWTIRKHGGTAEAVASAWNDDKGCKVAVS